MGSWDQERTVRHEWTGHYSRGKGIPVKEERSGIDSMAELLFGSPKSVMHRDEKLNFYFLQ